VARPATYVQLFRSGYIEAVDTLLMNDEGCGDKGIDRPYPEYGLVTSVKDYLRFGLEHGVPNPVCVSVCILGVGGYRMERRRNNWPTHRSKTEEFQDTFDRNVLTLPDVVLEDSTIDVERAFHPALDAC
jgi:hypothetical protein